MNLEFAIDLLLKTVFALTCGLVTVKFCELWVPLRWLEQMPATEPAFGAWLEKRERFLAVLATIVSTAPFLGLAGTIVHIIKALSGMAGGAGDLSVISGPIAQALYATLWGLASAVPANIFYNLAVRRLQVFENQFHRKSGRSA